MDELETSGRLNKRVIELDGGIIKFFKRLLQYNDIIIFQLAYKSITFAPSLLVIYTHFFSYKDCIKRNENSGPQT